MSYQNKLGTKKLAEIQIWFYSVSCSLFRTIKEQTAVLVIKLNKLFAYKIKYHSEAFIIIHRNV